MTNLLQAFVQRARSQKPSQPIVREQTHTELVDEIHETFYTEVDRLLDESKSIKAVSGEIMNLVEKEAILAKNGFYRTTVKTSIDKQVELTVLADENSRKVATVEAIQYFSQKYPQYKFITEDSIKKICQKYGLIYSTPDRYIGFVPEKNVKDISEFKIDPVDECYYDNSYYFVTNAEGDRYFNKPSFDELKRKLTNNEIPHLSADVKFHFGEEYISWDHRICAQKETKIIAAPIKDFDTSNMKIENFKLIPNMKDPVIFHPIQFKGYKFYLIVTAWGQEASDPMVVNERMN